MPFIFKHGAQKADQILRQYQYPEYTFVGRSNVGKSSLINAVANHKGLARTSKTPGRTQQINYFFEEKRKLYLVDLPGYGFSKVEHTLQKSWQDLMTAYFKDNSMLKCVFILVDIRRGIMDVDERMLSYLREYDIPYQVLFTKADKKDPSIHLPKGVLLTSSETKMGVAELQKKMGL